ncbi:phosphoribosylformylglycinamidine cyclo-ligase [Pullulanibacillus pueri]|uniref:Phosphoribosylformylglycinamidine cyclo-ligase n=1 Tax=Pullulanibacillus pueri TaxID=1437324 RepID=A0A8J2ZW72_9BACL|nr:phosphoribosylformylglycinamidine cyclo-ligase [Pullulanibacillus pueri]MBM7682756.1 phosphoribosylformylglycinamidine cyclo-ligase [Pullulanibacillus pueri]GGH83067.1 phosphoribosylformylglycinamidine cyclo-ligase [Pullulanibacillus pueri]
MAEAYKQSGVNIEAGYSAVEKIKGHAKRTMRPGVLGGIGAFGAAFDLSELNMKAPVLISGTDGVGTKLMLAQAFDQHDTIGIDVVAMCVNDIVTQGATPLYFLDYIACGTLDPDKIERIVKGVADGCEQAGCALVGGETAEMPGMYDPHEYDIAGFAVGAVEKDEQITGEHIAEGDVLIGLASNGIHSNGYSLVRKIMEDAALDPELRLKTTGKLLKEELLAPTRIYVKPIVRALEQVNIKGMAHITGGGFYENIPRMLPEGLGVDIARGSWPIPPIFPFLQEHGGLTEADLFSTFNMGIGMVLVVNRTDQEALIHLLESLGESAYAIGTVVKGSGVSL